MQPLQGPHRRHAGTRHRRAVRHAPARRPGRARHQDRAPRHRRLRARLRPARARAGLALRLDQPQQGEPDAGREAPAARPRLLQRLVLDKADVRGAEPGARRRGAAGPGLRARWRRRSRGLIVCDISGYGDDRHPGPYRDKKAYDLLIQSEAGFVSVTGTPDEPSKAGAVDRRHRRRHVRLQQHPGRAAAARRDGRGRRIDIWMLEAMGEWMGYPLYYAFDGAAAAAARRRRTRHDLPLRPVPHRRRQDGDAGPAERTRVGQFCDKVLLQPALATDARFTGNAARSGRARGAARAHRRGLRAR